jgi:mitochondrial fission protein ELM1
MDVRTKSSRVWILTGNRQGDNNQLFALADGLGLPYEVKQIRYNRLRHVAFLRGEKLLHLTRRTRRSIAPPWPDLVIGVGYESVPVSRTIRRRSGGRARLVQIGNPRTEHGDLDLIITTPQYSLAENPGLVALPFPIGNPARSATETPEEAEWLKGQPRPRRLVAVGGSTRQWKIDEAELSRAVRHLQGQVALGGGSVIAVTSRRTTPRILRLLKSVLNGGTNACVENFPRFSVLLASCDEFYVTADSVSMLSEAILTGKPVGMIPIARSLRGQIGHWIRRRGWNLRSHADLARFWRYLAVNGLAGTVDAPIASNARDTVGIAVAAVRELTDREPGSR